MAYVSTGHRVADRRYADTHQARAGYGACRWSTAARLAWEYHHTLAQYRASRSTRVSPYAGSVPSIQ
eukprot:62626-Rhodomonas_salina.1